MTDNSTTREPDVSTTQRHSYMAALSLAETLLSETTALPTDFIVSAADWEPGAPSIRFYFHDTPGLVREFAAQFSLEVAVRPAGSGGEYTEASGFRDGVRVRAWALLSAEQVAERTAVTS
ncbi:hypothetical protein B7C62_28225 [Kitasatospora albolonga]|uniref:Uncharacterized protein n=1 Tax=Kitasatospora albolonga TaxID=68173 RepID=A0ABC8C1A0_9ACTN|nr:hypothetical protein B7C62_28225 [Kitasatospora albolonga]